MRTTGNTILVTGGGTGIGQALAHRLHDAGNVVIVAGRRREALAETIAGRARMSALELDVQDAASIAAAARRVTEEHPELNVLVNNAGIMRSEELGAQRDLADAEATITTNLLGPMRMTNALIDHLKARPDVAVVNVSSGLAFVPLVATPTYSATKAALHSYSVSLRQKLKGQVEIIEIIPPGVQTELVPGQTLVERFMSLDAFVDEVMELLGRQPTPPEICVERVKFLRYAERDGNFDEALAMLSAG